MGADKALQTLAGQPLIKRVIDRASTQVHEIIISANGDPSRFSNITDATVIVDDTGGYEGPLAGLAACLSWLTDNRPNIRWVATFPVDCPFFPKNLVSSLLAAAERDRVPAFATSGGRSHPVFSLWPRGMEPALRQYLVKGKRSSLAEFIKSQKGREVAFEPSSPDPFFNINTRSELLQAENLVRSTYSVGGGD